ncbi:MAG: hypothetical protein KAI73_05760 [Rhodospirillaceae bacterium]|nr:hypothetical protein [Rhodospirillaceae bacterium]
MNETPFSVSKVATDCPDYRGQDQVFTRGIIAKHRRSTESFGLDYYSDVLHHDEAPVEGKAYRVFDLAQEMANELGQPLYAAFVTYSGGISKMIRPEKEK